jgi:hypothetical protein
MNRASLLALMCFAPASALAQPIYQNPTSDAPTTLNPSASGNQAPPPQAAPQPARPEVMIVGPDGKVTPAEAPPTEPSGYYVPGPGTPTGFEEPAEVHGGPVPELHVVRSGDTLWDISFFYFNDPWQWPKVWSYNAQITNPHWIYPGDLVRLLPRGMFVQPSDISDPEKAPEVAARPADPVPVPARRLEVGIKNVAFVEKEDLKTSMAIDGSVDEKLLLGNGDQVYISYPEGKPPQVGKRYSVYLPGQPVRMGDKEYGSYVRVLGTVEVVSVKEDKRARGVLLEVNREVERGAKVGPLVTRFKNAAPVPPKVNAQGTIVAMLAHDQLIGQGEVVFIDLGKSSGIEAGNRMFVVRRGDAFPERMSNEIGSDDRRFPARALGEIVVVEVGKSVSIGLVTLAVQEMSVGDLVMMQKAR